MSNSTGFDDEENTPLLAPPDGRALVAAPFRASVTGDFRTYETTFATMAFDDVYEVRLASDSGAMAHFAVDAQLAPRLAGEFKRQLSTPYYRHVLLGQRPSSPRREPLGDPGTHIFFTAADQSHLSVEREREGDRMVLMLFDAETSLNITLQVGVALDLYDFFAATIRNS
jgi:hypothetical protein